LRRPPRVQRIGRTEWATALGQPRRVGDWFELFGNELSEEPWRAVLERWVPRLAPGIVAAALHGVIRTGHAVRAIAFEDTPPRRRELLRGCAPAPAGAGRRPGVRGGGVSGVAEPRAPGASRAALDCDRSRADDSTRRAGRLRVTDRRARATGCVRAVRGDADCGR